MSYQAFDAEWTNEQDAEARDEAEQLADQLVTEGSIAREGPRFGGGPLSLRYEGGYELADAAVLVGTFDRQRRVLAHLELDFPCLHIGDKTPLPYALSLGVPNEAFSATKERLSAQIEGLREQGAEVVLHPTDEATGFLRRRLAAFLAPRIAKARESDPQPPNGFPFRAETPGRHGLRIHYSASALLESGKIFGERLSTPVESLIPTAGRYFFGTESKAGELGWDFLAEYRIPGPPDVAIIR